MGYADEYFHPYICCNRAKLAVALVSEFKTLLLMLVVFYYILLRVIAQVNEVINYGLSLNYLSYLGQPLVTSRYLNYNREVGPGKSSPISSA